MGKIKDMPLKRAFVTLTFISLFVAIVLSILSFWGIELIRSSIMEKYYLTHKGTTLNPNIILVDLSVFSQADQMMLKSIDYLKLVLPLSFSIISIIAAAYIFYNVKLKKPLTLLKNSAKKISDNDLDFTIDLKSKDEMGVLCTSFEKMRKELLNNNIKMWRLMEERKRLNAAFAHDLRTPITVLKGYTDVLESYVPTGKISQEKMISTISLMSDNVVRLEKYVDSMNSIHKLENTDIYPTEVKTADFIKKLESSTQILSEEQGKLFTIDNQIVPSTITLDEEIILRVIENIISNAFRYAKKHIYIKCSVAWNLLVFEVTDDGKGFNNEDVKLATEPFYKDKSITDSNHLGLGLNISKILCQRHGGSLTLANAKDSGAKVTATFSLIVDKK